MFYENPVHPDFSLVLRRHSLTDTANNSSDLGYCALAKLDHSKSKMDSIYNSLLIKLDSLNLDDHKFRMELLEDDPDYPTEGMTDYEEIIRNLKISQSSYLEYADLESEIVGEFMGQGRERSIHQNLKKAALYDIRSKQLLDYFK